MKSEELHIIRRIVQGETKLFEQLLQAYSQQTFRLIVRIVGNREDAEDLTQDTFLKAYQHLNRFKGDCNFSTWLYSIAYNMAISSIRKQKFDTQSMDDEMLARLSDQQVDEVLNDEREEQLAALNRAIDRLNTDERVLIDLHYYEEQPLSEVAFILGITENNAKVKLHRVRRKLYLFIKEENV